MTPRRISDRRMVRNLPTPDGIALGKELARLADASPMAGRPRCATCAFRGGTEANGCAPTLMDAIKSEGDTFWCHENEDKPCAGWAAARKELGGSTTVAPWDFVGGED